MTREISKCVKTLTDESKTPNDIYTALHNFYIHYKNRHWGYCFEKFMKNDYNSEDELLTLLTDALKKFIGYRENRGNAFSMLTKRADLVNGLNNVICRLKKAAAEQVIVRWNDYSKAV